MRESLRNQGSAARKIWWVTEVQDEKICWVTEVQRENYAGSRKPTATRRRAALVAPSPRRPFGVLCSSVPQSDFHSHPPLAEDAPSFWASPSDLRHRAVARSLALLSRPSPSPSPPSLSLSTLRYPLQVFPALFAPLSTSLSRNSVTYDHIITSPHFVAYSFHHYALQPVCAQHLGR